MNSSVLGIALFSFAWCFFPLFSTIPFPPSLFFETGSDCVVLPGLELKCRPGWPQTLICLPLLPKAGIKGVCHHIGPEVCFQVGEFIVKWAIINTFSWLPWLRAPLVWTQNSSAESAGGLDDGNDSCWTKAKTEHMCQSGFLLIM